MIANLMPAPRRRGRVIALHCSGAGAAQWTSLGEALRDDHELLAPEHYGAESGGAWSGEHAFALQDEAARVIALVDRSEGQVHLVGHSYGGGVALHVALARRDKIASMALYEPSAFHLLRQMGANGTAAYSEIVGIAARVAEGIVSGDRRGAMAAFVGYWNGPQAWAAMRPALQQALVRWAPKAPLDFRALINEPVLASAYRTLDFPVLILRGEHAPTPTRLIAERLSQLLPSSRLIAIDGAGHMGPLTHAPKVSDLIVRHIKETAIEATKHPSRRWRDLAEAQQMKEHAVRERCGVCFSR